MSDIRLIDIVNAIRARWRTILAIVATTFLILLVFILKETPMYRAYVMLAPSPPLVNPNVSSLDMVLPGIGGITGLGVFQEPTSKRHALALLRSKAISRQFIENENLLPILFAEKWDSDKRTWRDTERVPTLGDGLRFFEREVRFISRNEATGIVRVNIEWTDPALAANWANGLVELTDRAVRDRDIAEARQSMLYLEKRASESSLESVKQLIYRLIESYAKKIMVANVKDSYVFTVIDPAVVPEADDTINMPLSLKFAMALIFALGLGVLWSIVASRVAVQSS